MIRKTVLIFVTLFLSFFSTIAVAETNPIARQKGINAFFALERSWDRKSILYARDEIESGEQMDKDEPWLMAARARLYLVVGYKSHNNVDAGAVQEALSLAKKAAKNAPKDAFILTFYAGRLYQTGENKKAWEVLQEAMAADPKNPYPIYRVANFIGDAKDAKSLKTWLDKAKAVDTKDHYKDRRIELERKLCSLESNLACVDAKWREEIALTPTNPWSHGNYASYLKRVKRYKEAKVEYQKALALMEYPMARKGLEDVERILASEAIGKN